MNVRHRNDETIRLGCGTGNATQLTQKPRKSKVQKCQSKVHTNQNTKAKHPTHEHTNTQTHEPKLNQQSTLKAWKKPKKQPQQSVSTEQPTNNENRESTQNKEWRFQIPRFRDSEIPLPITSSRQNRRSRFSISLLQRC